MDLGVGLCEGIGLQVCSWAGWLWARAREREWREEYNM